MLQIRFVIFLDTITAGVMMLLNRPKHLDRSARLSV